MGIENEILPHGAHADHYENHGHDKDIEEAGETEKPMGDGAHADHYEDHGKESDEKDWKFKEVDEPIKKPKGDGLKKKNKKK
jgi:hypothetical protein